MAPQNEEEANSVDRLVDWLEAAVKPDPPKPHHKPNDNNTTPMAATRKKKQIKQITLIEGISEDDRGRDMPILREFFRMLGWNCVVQDATGKRPQANKEKFLDELLRTQSRFIHVSAHGSGSDLTLDQGGVGPAEIKLSDIRSYREKKELPKHPLSERFLTISACGDIAPSFALGLHQHAGATAVISPLASLDFHESALFAMMFYFTPLTPSNRKESHKTSERISQYIDSFNRTKVAYLSVGGSGAHRLDYWWRKEHVTVV